MPCFINIEIVNISSSGAVFGYRRKEWRTKEAMIKDAHNHSHIHHEVWLGKYYGGVYTDEDEVASNCKAWEQSISSVVKFENNSDGSRSIQRKERRSEKGLTNAKIGYRKNDISTFLHDTSSQSTYFEIWTSSSALILIRSLLPAKRYFAWTSSASHAADHHAGSCHESGIHEQNRDGDGYPLDYASSDTEGMWRNAS